MSQEKDYSWAVPKGFVPPVEVDSRICFGIQWFETEEAADAYAAEVKRKGITYNGGFYHGMPCGRDTGWDKEKDGRKLYAVTD